MKRMLLLLAVACDDVPRGPGITACENVKEYPERLPPNLDLLIVVDESPAMAGVQDVIAMRLPDVVTRIDDHYDHPRIDFHIGVVSSDIGDGGAGNPGCTGDGRGGRLVAPLLTRHAFPDGRTESNFTGELGEAVAAMATLGADGCSVSRPLTATQWALDGRNPDNEGFLRDDAALGIIFVTAGDDCSAASQLRDLLASHDREVIVGLIAGRASGCAADPVTAEPAVCLEAFLDAFPNRNASSSICGLDWTEAVDPLVASIHERPGWACLDGNILVVDLDEDQPGLQLPCEGADVAPDGDETRVGRCDPDGPRPCWWTEVDPIQCSDTQTGILVHVDGTEWPEPGTWFRLRCEGTCGQ